MSANVVNIAFENFFFAIFERFVSEASMSYQILLEKCQKMTFSIFFHFEIEALL